MDFLRKLGTAEIDLLISDVDLLRQGYQIEFAIDAYDIFEYTFPYGIYFDKIHDIKPDDIGDILIAYEYIFNNFFPIILDQYKVELILNRNVIKSTTDSRIEKDILFFALDENVLDKESITESSTFLLATALMQANFLNGFDHIYKTRLQFEDKPFSLPNQEDSRLLQVIFREAQKTEWSTKAFLAWAKDKGDFDYKDNEVVKEFKSTIRDFVAIDRLISINRRLQSDTRLSKKYLILYFSGADKSIDIFNRKDVLSNMPTINGIKRYNLLRTRSQSFLLFLTFNKDYDIMRKSLIEFRELAKKRETLMESFNERDLEDYIDYFRKMNIRRRSLLENSFIESQINLHRTFQDSITKQINRIKNEHNLFDLKEQYANLLVRAREVNAKSELIQSNSSYLLQKGLIHLILKLKDNEQFSIYKGMDLIKGVYHHLPILLFFDKESIIPNADLENLYLRLTDYVISATDYRSERLQKLIGAIQGVYSEIEKENQSKEYFYELLIKVFILIFIEPAEEINNEVVDIVEQGYANLRTNQVAFDKWANDYLYMLIWISRRIKDFRKCSYFCEKGLSEYPSDPRFYHGKVLLLYNNSHQQGNLCSCRIESLLEILKYSEKAIDLYKCLMNDPSQQRFEFANYIEGSISAIKNLILYTVSIFYLDKLENDQDLQQFPILAKYSLSYLRNYLLEKIRTFEEKTQNPSKSWAEYSHTEAVLELVEAIANKSKDKIEFAFVEINKAIALMPGSNLYKVTLEKIIFWKNRL